VLEHAGNVSLELSAAWRAGDGRSGGLAESRVIDKKLLESALQLAHGTRVDCLLGIVDSRWSGWSRSGGRFDIASAGRFFVSRAGLTRPFVLDSGWFRCNRLLFLDVHSETKLELGLGSTVKLLVDGCIVRVKDDESCGAVGVTFEDSFGGRRNGKEEAELHERDGQL
jgi:hypothetical protein